MTSEGITTWETGKQNRSFSRDSSFVATATLQLTDRNMQMAELIREDTWTTSFLSDSEPRRTGCNDSGIDRKS